MLELKKNLLRFWTLSLYKGKGKSFPLLMHWPSWLWMFPCVGRLTNKHITTAYPQRRFWVVEQRNLGFDGLKLRMPEWRRRLYDDVIALQQKALVFYHWYYVNRYTYVVERSVSTVNDFTLNGRHIFNHSIKEHPYLCSRYRINTLVANWIFFAVSFI